jgi:hypothetical protein
MRQERVVELRYRTRIQGTGYLVSSRLVLTARHLVKSPGQHCQIQPLLAVDASVRPETVSARVGWISSREGVDAAVLVLDREIKVDDEPVLWARLPRGVGAIHAFAATGFPQITGAQSHPFFGRVAEVADTGWLDLHIEGALPDKWSSWRGASGALVFCGSHAVGIVRSVDKRFTGKLTATPLHRLLEDPDFCEWWQRQDLPLPKTPNLGEDSPLELIGGHLHRLNRVDQTESILDWLSDLEGPRRAGKCPKIVLISGYDADLHHKFIQKLAESAEIQSAFGRSVRPEDLIVELPWPLQERISAPGRALLALLEPLFAATGAQHELGQELNDRRWLSAVSAKLDSPFAPRAYWTLVRNDKAFGNHATVLERLVEFWMGLSCRQETYLFLCMTRDEPPPRASSPFDFFSARPEHESNLLHLARDILTTVPSAQLLRVQELAAITSPDVDSWLRDFRSRVRSLSNVEISLFGAVLKRYLGESGLRLLAVEASLGELLHKALSADKVSRKEG